MASKNKNYNLNYHLQKIKDARVRRIYKNVYEYAHEELEDVTSTFNSGNTYLRHNGKKFAILYAQVKKMAIDVEGDYSDFPKFKTIKQGSKFKDGKTINFHINAGSSEEEAKSLVKIAYKNRARNKYHAKNDQRIIFFNIGWMKYYQGIPTDESDNIEGGGSFVKEHGYGFEIYNFQPYSGKLYGYVQPVTGKAKFSKGQIRIERLGALKSAESIDGVTVIFTGKSRKSGIRRIVGWYKNAIVFRYRQKPPKNSGRTFKGEDIGFYSIADESNCILLDEAFRDDLGIQIPTGKDGMGESNVWYADHKQNRDFVNSIFDLIDIYSPDNEIEDMAYQQSINTLGDVSQSTGPVPRPTTSSVSHKQWKKDASVARGVLKDSKYQCSVDPDHLTFISKASSNDYMEAHHLIPMNQQEKYSVSLDVRGNIVCLCPTCHRLLHFGTNKDKLPVLRLLFDAKLTELKSYGIEVSFRDIIGAYDIQKK